MKHKEYIQMLFKSAAIVCLVLGYASCVDDAEVSSLHKNQFSDVVTFGFGNSSEWTPDVIGESGSSRARSLALPMDCEDGELPNGEIYMYMLEEDAPAVVDTVSIDSRSGNSEVPAIGIFAYKVPGEDSETPLKYNPEADGVSVFMNNVNSSEYAESSEKKYWPGGGSWLQFYGYKPYCDSETSVVGLSLSTVGNNPTFTYDVPLEVGSQSDLMVAAPENMLYGTHCKEVELTLQHILSKVQVKVGNIPSGEVKSISFENIYCNATYSFVTGSWELIVKDEKKEKNNYIQESPRTDADSKIIGEPFHFLPQELSDDAKIKIVLSVTTDDPNSRDENATRTKEYTVSKKIKDFKDTWAKDKQYTYVITTPQQVDVEVSDKVEGRVKKDLVIKNTGLAPAYIRAAIIGNWVQFTEKTVDDAVSGQDGKEIIEKKIVSKWNETEYGTFDWGHDGDEHVSVTIGEIPNSLPTCWVRCSDGYFYYTELVQPGEELKVGNHPLFASYTLTSAPDMADIALELIIAVQAVYPDDLELLWKKEIADILLSKQSN